MKLSALEPDKTLATILDKQIIVEDKPIRAYANAERSNDNLGTDFIEVLYNGNPQSLTQPIGYYEGDIALVIYSLANTDNTAKKNRMRRILEQVEKLVDGVAADYIFFKLSANPITPAKIDSQTGYGVMALNLEWHTTTELAEEPYEIKLTITTDGEFIYPKTSWPLGKTEGFCPLTCGRHRRKYVNPQKSPNRRHYCNDTGRLWAAQYLSLRPLGKNSYEGYETVIFPYRLNEKGALRSILNYGTDNADLFDLNWVRFKSTYYNSYINVKKTQQSNNGIKANKGEKNYILYGVAVYRLIMDGNSVKKAVRISNVVYVKRYIECLETITNEDDFKGRGITYDSWFEV